MQYLLMIYSQENGWNEMSDSERQQGCKSCWDSTQRRSLRRS